MHQFDSSNWDAFTLICISSLASILFLLFWYRYCEGGSGSHMHTVPEISRKYQITSLVMWLWPRLFQGLPKKYFLRDVKGKLCSKFDEGRYKTELTIVVVDNSLTRVELRPSCASLVAELRPKMKWLDFEDCGFKVKVATWWAIWVNYCKRRRHPHWLLSMEVSPSIVMKCMKRSL